MRATRSGHVSARCASQLSRIIARSPGRTSAGIIPNMPIRHKQAPPEAELYAPIEWRSAGEFTDIRYEKADGIAKITINRPEVRNAFRPQTLAELRDAFNRARDDLDVGSVIFTQIGTNLANDYSDAKRGADAADRLGPVRVTSSGLVAPRRVLVATWIAFAVAVAAGIYLATVAGIVILIVGAASILAGVLYTGGPRPYGYAGLGEVFVFLFFGLVAVNGSYYVQLEELEWLPFALSVSVGCLSTAILVVNNVRDIDTDRRAGKRTLAVR